MTSQRDLSAERSPTKIELGGFAVTDRSNESTTASDRTLVRRVSGGEADAATALYLRYATRLQRLVHYQTGRGLARFTGSEDIVQSVFRTFFRRAAIGHYQVADSDELWKLFLVMALNKIRRLAEYHGAAKRDQSRTVSSEGQRFEAESTYSSEQAAALQTLQLTIDEILTELPTGHAEVVRLRVAGNTLPEIASQTGRSLRTIERVLKEFRERLLALTGGVE
jgi:RNA polymerase sigma-70 factor, ECF subfamily